MIRLFRVRVHKNSGLCSTLLEDSNWSQSDVKPLLSASTRTHTATSTARIQKKRTKKLKATNNETRGSYV